MKILTELQRTQLLNRTAFTLPDNPSANQRSPEQIKKKLYEGIMILFDWLRETQNEVKTEIDKLTFRKLDADLEAIASLTGSYGFLVKTAENTWVIDTVKYLKCDDAISNYLQKVDAEKLYATIENLNSTNTSLLAEINKTLAESKTYTDQEKTNTVNYIDKRLTDLIGLAPETLDTLYEIALELQNDQKLIDLINTEIVKNSKAIEENKKNIDANSLAIEGFKKSFFVGTHTEYEQANASGSIALGAIVYITDDDEQDVQEDLTSAVLGTAVLGYMILG